MIYLVFCIILASNVVHASGIFNVSSYSTISTAGISTAVIAGGNSGLGDVLNGVAYGAGGGLWAAINFVVNIPFPMLMILDMGLPLLIAGALQALWFLLLGLGLTEAILGRDLLT